MRAVYRLNKRAQEGPAGWGFIIMLIIALFALFIIIWISGKSGTTIIDMFKGLK